MSPNFQLLNPLSAYQAMEFQPNSLRMTVANITAILPQVFFDLSSAAQPNLLYLNTLDMTELQFEGMGTSPFGPTIVPAPGAGRIVLPIALVLSLRITTAYPLTRSIFCEYQGIGNVALTVSQGMGLNVLNNRVISCGINTNVNFTIPPNPANLPVILRASGTIASTGVVANPRAQLLYTIVEAPGL